VDTVGSFNLTKGTNKFCLAEPGIYQLTPVSCHQFERSVYTYDTYVIYSQSLSFVSSPDNLDFNFALVCLFFHVKYYD